RGLVPAAEAARHPRDPQRLPSKGVAIAGAVVASWQCGSGGRVTARGRRASGIQLASRELVGARPAVWLPIAHGTPFSRKSTGTAAADVPRLPRNPNETRPPLGAMMPFQFPAVL